MFNGKYSTTCYVDETLHALNDMYEKRALDPVDYLAQSSQPCSCTPLPAHAGNGLGRQPTCLRSAAAMPMTAQNWPPTATRPAWNVECMCSRRDDQQTPRSPNFADPERLHHEAYPLTMAVLRGSVRRATIDARFSTNCALGSDTMLDLGNLYTAGAAGMDGGRLRTGAG